MRRLFLVPIFVAALVALAFLGSRVLFNGGEPAQAVPAGTVDEVAIDMDPFNVGINIDGYGTANGGSLGTRQSCMSYPVGTVFDVDVTVRGIDVGDMMAGYQFDLIFNNAQLNVVGISDGTMMLDEAPGSGPIVPLSNPVGLGIGLSPYTAAASDFGAGTEWADGVLARVQFQSVGPGITNINLANIIVADAGGLPIPTITTVLNAIEAQDEPCPLPQDIKNLGLELDPNSWVPPLADLDGDTLADDVEVSVDYDYTLLETLHNNGPDDTSPDVISIDATPDPGIEVSYHCQGGEVVTLNGGVIDPNCQASTRYWATAPDVLDVHMTVGPFPISVAQVIPFNFDLHCLEPSTHSILFEKTVDVENPFNADPDPGNNSAQTTVTVDCVANSDIKVVSQSIIPALTEDSDYDGVNDAFLVDNGVDDDGDTQVDEDPINGIDDDVPPDGLIDEDGGDVLAITISKDLHNNGPWGDTNVTDVLTAIQANPNAAACGVSLSNQGPFVAGTGDFQQLNLPVTVVQPASYTIYLHCGMSGYLVDDDGDAIDGIDGVADAFIDEDPPDGIDNDGDTQVDEDGPVALPTIVANDCADIKDPHVVDPVPDMDLLDPPTMHDACGVPAQLTIVGVLPFTPSATVTIGDVDPGVLSSPTDPPDTCRVTIPCKMQWDYNIPGGDLAHQRGGTIGDRGGQPLASASLIEADADGDTIPDPGVFSITQGQAITNGDVLSAVFASTTLRAIPGTPCATAVPMTFGLADGKLPDAIDPPDMVNGFPDNTPDSKTALGNNASWSTDLNAWTNVLLAANPGSQLWEREVGVAMVGGSPIPINLVVIDLGGFGVGPWLYSTYIGDPDNDSDGILDDLDPDDDNDGIPDAQDKDADGDGTENSLELAQCAPLGVQLLSLGVSQSGFNDITGLPTPGGAVKRVCNIINPKPPAGTGHLYATSWTRADIGTGFIDKAGSHMVGCTGESDIKASIIKDESPGDGIPGPNPPGGIDNDADTQIDEDPTVDGIDQDGDGIDGEDPVDDIVKAGEPQHIPVLFDVENGDVPGDVDVELSLIGPSACSPTWIAEAGDSLSTNTLAGITTSTITRSENGMAANEVRYLTRKYEVTCPPGAHSFDIFNNVASASGLPDPDLDNNQAQNHPLVIADGDVDGDTVPNPQDNCNWVQNPGQEDLDQDGVGDACDPDDDGDGVPDIDDDCPTIPEDLDGVDDTDGCPDTDVSIIKITPDAYDVDVSVPENVPLSVKTTNGNYPADIQTNITLVSIIGQCEVTLNAGPGDAFRQFKTDEDGDGFDDHLWSEMERVDFYLPLETKVFDRSYDIHCYQRSTHGPGKYTDPAGFEIAVDALPLPPVVEEDQSNNVEKNYPIVTAWDKADVKKVGIAIIGSVADPADCAGGPILAVPASIKVSEDLHLCLGMTLHNNGPVETLMTDVLSYSQDPNVGPGDDCTLTPASPQNASGINGPVSVPVSHYRAVTIHCTEQSNHLFHFNDHASQDAGQQIHTRDPIPDNNDASTDLAIAVIADADVKVTGVAIGGLGQPPQIAVSDQVPITITATIHNNGPAPATNAPVTVTANAPLDCTLDGGPSVQTVQNVNLPVSTPVNVVLNATLHCSEPSFHTIEVTADVGDPLDLHIIDPDPSNNTDGTSAQFAAILTMEKEICDVYIGPGPVPAAQTGPANGCPAQNPWNGGVDEIAVVPSTINTLVSDDLDYSSDAVNIKKTATLSAIAGGPQDCDISTPDDDPLAAGIQQILQEAEPPGLSTEPTPLQWDIHLPLPLHDGEPNWCLLEYTVVKEIKDEHVVDGTPGDLEVTITNILVAADTDGDGVYDNAAGELDNCKLLPNSGQEDSNGNGTGDDCDRFNDVGEKYIVVLGPSAINLSDSNGRYMWVIGEMGNFSEKIERVTISLDKQPPMPAGCTQQDDLILPGQSTFLLLAGEQKYQVYRVRFECHDPAQPQIITLTITKCIDIDDNISSHDDDGDTLIDEDSRNGVDDDGDSEDGEDPQNPDDVPGNDCKSTTKQILIDQP